MEEKVKRQKKRKSYRWAKLRLAVTSHVRDIYPPLPIFERRARHRLAAPKWRNESW